MNVVEPIRSREKIEQIKRYLKEKGPPRNYLFFVLGINFALRIGDFRPLKVKNVRNVDGSLKRMFYLRESKTNKQKCVQINESSRQALNYYFSKVDAKQDDYLFQGRGYKPLDRAHLWQLINNWARKAGLEDRFGSHSFRKTWGYMARKQGVPIELIQAKFNHATPSVTRRYLGITNEDVARIERMVNL